MIITKDDYTTAPAQVHYLEMHHNPHFVLTHKQAAAFKLLEKPISAETYRHYYKNVGLQYNWLDRLAIPDEDLQLKINEPNIAIFALQIDSADAGYAEFAIVNEYVEIVYFGLFASFVGKGLGKFFLEWCISKAWDYEPKWVQLNTCSLDHANALGVYESAGFKVVRTATEERKILLKN